MTNKTKHSPYRHNQKMSHQKKPKTNSKNTTIEVFSNILKKSYFQTSRSPQIRLEFGGSPAI